MVRGSWVSGSWVGGSWVLSRGWWVVRPRSPYEINTSYIHSFYAVSNSRELSAIFEFSQHLKICGTYKKEKKKEEDSPTLSSKGLP